VILFVSGPTRLGTKSEACNILVAGCLCRVEPNRIVIVTPQAYSEVRVWVWHNNLVRDPMRFSNFFFLICLVFCGWLCKFKIIL